MVRDEMNFYEKNLSYLQEKMIIIRVMRIENASLLQEKFKTAKCACCTDKKAAERQVFLDGFI